MCVRRVLDWWCRCDVGFGGGIFGGECEKTVGCHGGGSVPREKSVEIGYAGAGGAAEECTWSRGEMLVPESVCVKLREGVDKWTCLDFEEVGDIHVKIYARSQLSILLTFTERITDQS